MTDDKTGRNGVVRIAGSASGDWAAGLERSRARPAAVAVAQSGVAASGETHEDAALDEKIEDGRTFERVETEEPLRLVQRELKAGHLHILVEYATSQRIRDDNRCMVHDVGCWFVT